MSTQRYEIEAWLGDDHDLTSEQIDELVAISDEIAARYPDEDDAYAREQALTIAHRLLIEPEVDVVDDLSLELRRARNAERLALVGLRQAACQIVQPDAVRGAGVTSQQGFAAAAGLNRTAVRDWLGKH